MSTSKPRITITLEPHAYEVVRRLSAANGHPMSAIVSGFLDVALPPMERMVVLLEQAAAMPHATREEIRASVLRAEARVLPEVASLARQVDFLVDESVAAGSVAEVERRRRATGAKRRQPTPVPVTRGSGFPKGTSGRAKRGRV